ncbi:MAG: hypothetical protein MUF15_04185 [Acidobacteria bacterium]|nr:hypothetical protein [Acidobacteriota bacterium]
MTPRAPDILGIRRDDEIVRSSDIIRQMKRKMLGIKSPSGNNNRLKSFPPATETFQGNRSVCRLTGSAKG